MKDADLFMTVLVANGKPFHPEEILFQEQRIKQHDGRTSCQDAKDHFTI